MEVRIRPNPGLAELCFEELRPEALTTQEVLM